MVINDFHGKYFFLSNFYPSPIEYNGRIWPTVEHAFQAAKVDVETAEKIFQATTPGEAKRFGRQGKMRDDWDVVRIDVMRECLRSKFLNNSELKQKLLDTGDAILIEGTTWHDNYWGVCSCDKCRNKGIPGKNMLGILLMEVREEAKNN